MLHDLAEDELCIDVPQYSDDDGDSDDGDCSGDASAALEASPAADDGDADLLRRLRAVCPPLVRAAAMPAPELPCGGVTPQSRRLGSSSSPSTKMHAWRSPSMPRGMLQQLHRCWRYVGGRRRRENAAWRG